MKNKHILIIGGVLLIVVVLYLGKNKNEDPSFDYSKLSPITAIQDSPIDFGKLSPSDAVQLFILASKAGDENTVRSLITEQPDSYLEYCLDKQDAAALHKSFPVEARELSISLPYTKQVTYSTKKSAEEFAALASCPDCPLPYIEARFIWATQNAFAKIKLTSSSIYRNEATVDVEYVVSESSGSKHIFLLSNNGGWKVFATANPELEPSWLKENYQNYAKHRPLCRKN